jgi:hypothetical protein
MDLDALLEEAAELWTQREISPGQEIEIHDLKRRSDLNEQRAIVQKQLPNGRLEVRIVLTGDCISISRDNATITEAVPAPPVVGGLTRICDANLSMNANPFVWANKGFFYPFGNTPAKSLLQHVPADQACANLLLLGCGDPRHLLYSAYCNQKAGGMAAQQSLSLVMCDIIPSILARNIVLYKLLLDGAEGAVVWTGTACTRCSPAPPLCSRLDPPCKPGITPHSAPLFASATRAASNPSGRCGRSTLGARSWTSVR